MLSGIEGETLAMVVCGVTILSARCEESRIPCLAGEYDLGVRW